MASSALTLPLAALTALPWTKADAHALGSRLALALPLLGDRITLLCQGTGKTWVFGCGTIANAKALD